jgi:ATP-binding cassette subfamily B (MDR/TAP) protein 1
MNIELKDKNNLRDSIELDRNLASKSEIIMASGRMIEQKQINDENKQFTKVPFFKLMYTFASRKDVFLLIGAVIGSLIAGTSMPFIALLLGKAINNFGSGMLDLGQEVLTEKITQLAIIYILVGLAIFLGSFMMVFFWTWVGKRIINKINEEYLRVIMRQEPGWFDANNVFELPTKIQGQIKTIENGVNNY